MLNIGQIIDFHNIVGQSPHTIPFNPFDIQNDSELTNCAASSAHRCRERTSICGICYWSLILRPPLMIFPLLFLLPPPFLSLFASSCAPCVPWATTKSTRKSVYSVSWLCGSCSICLELVWLCIRDMLVWSQPMFALGLRVPFALCLCSGGLLTLN